MMKSQMSLLVMREENVNICIYISWDMKNEEHHEHTTLVFLRKCGPRFLLIANEESFSVNIYIFVYGWEVGIFSHSACFGIVGMSRCTRGQREKGFLYSAKKQFHNKTNNAAPLSYNSFYANKKCISISSIESKNSVTKKTLDKTHNWSGQLPTITL